MPGTADEHTDDDHLEIDEEGKQNNDSKRQMITQETDKRANKLQPFKNLKILIAKERELPIISRSSDRNLNGYLQICLQIENCYDLC